MREYMENNRGIVIDDSKAILYFDKDPILINLPNFDFSSLLSNIITEENLQEDLETR